MIVQTANSNPRIDVTIAAFTTEDGEDVVPDMTVDDRCYNKDEFDQLSAAEKLGFQVKRKKRGQTVGAGRGKRGGRGDGGGEKMELPNRSIKALATAVIAAAKKTTMILNPPLIVLKLRKRPRRNRKSLPAATTLLL
jgi:hypothetical protein